ncbi:MAG: alpha-glucan family phosphorylase, partial [Acidobacteriota bacterium]|nr:alpha-glucan family phosphorylase [Acidobacteriota bacterium]
TEHLKNTLTELALDLRWSWNHAADALWKSLDPALWDQTHNPWVVLQTVSAEQLERAAATEEFRKQLEEVSELRQQRRSAATQWFTASYPDSPLSAVAYFSMEYMLSEALPLFSGGLGNVAGDQLKAASDLGVPAVAVGLLYQQGYFRQQIDPAGRQLEFYPFNDPGQLPISPVRTQQGDWLRIQLAFPGGTLFLRTWQAQVGNRMLYLLDTNDPANLPEYRGIAAELYGGGPEQRLQQEVVLGIGGWRLLRAIGLDPEVCHLNEGHAAFAALERARAFMEANGRTFFEALAVTRAGNLFTTHTPVEAGFDRFAPDLMRQYLYSYCEGELKVRFEEILALGRTNPGDASEPFNMAWLAIRTSGAINGVSQLHKAVSRKLFQPLFPRWPEAEAPVGHVTNGVHTPSWDSAAADDLWTKACGKHRWRGALADLDQRLKIVPDAELWTMRAAARKILVEYVRDRLSRQLAGNGAPEHEVQAAHQIFDPGTLTIGFARRFTAYKRPNLLLHDRERLFRILSRQDRPVQLVIAGKAHPRDAQGHELIREWIDFIRHTPARAHVAFLADYNMEMSQQLVQGVDLWLNTPRRPWEASGTSGMKVLVNGGLNLSELDGWWAEAFTPERGWAIGDGQEHSDPGWDGFEAGQLYDLLEREVIPAFYTRNADGIPASWINRMRESMARLTPYFSSNRSVREYTVGHYLPAAEAYAKRAADKGAAGADLLAWRRYLDLHWPRIRFGALSVESEGTRHRFSIPVYIDEINPDHVAVELFAESFRKRMERGPALAGSGGTFTYSLSVETPRPAGDFTPRVIPRHPTALVPLEAPHILWYR